jgi:hypothetical protein
MYRRGSGEAMLASVRGGHPPRIHPINVGIVDGGLYAFIIGRSPKRMDLETDGRYALHAHIDPAEPSEFAIRGHARPIDDEDVRSRVAAEWPFEVDAAYRLFELSIDAAVHGERRSADEWPPRYTSWSNLERP